ncbi:MAG: glycine--tRNA ligase subunit beta [Proteobacteria bacterium]|nr:glycine--tRNA ligase subunit beta [Pseudomonadota bacterium]
MPTFLLEIGAEELPAGYVEPALAALAAEIGRLLNAARLTCGNVATYGTPRRLAVMAEGLPESQPDVEETVTGPPAKVGFDQGGRPTKAALGFARGQGLDPAELKVIDTPKGPYVGALKKVVGRPAKEALAPGLPEIISRLPFPKTMRWADFDVKFARPVRWLLCLLDDQVVPFTWGPLASGNLTRGHRFHAPEPMVVPHPSAYLDLLRRAEVVADVAARRDLIRGEVARAARDLGGRVYDDPGLINEVTNLVELPVAVAGRFDEHFLKIPDEVVITAMREHQRYFAVVDDAGKLLPAFIAINNTRVRDEVAAARGHERVLRARLADAEFFFNEDRKVGLDQLAQGLREVVFHSKLGASAEKVARLSALAEGMAEQIGLDEAARSRVRRAALLCKADLVSQMVGEFPSLQGVVGGAYARLQGEDEEVASAMAEHYRPAGAGDEIPLSVAGTLLSLADKLDSICGFFAVGIVPSGKADPFALRRQAIAVLRMLREKRDLDLSLPAVVERAVAQVADKGKTTAAYLAAEVSSFFRRRLDRMLVEEGNDPGVVDAVLEAGLDRVAHAVARVQALQKLLGDPEAAPLFVGLKRAFNILKNQDAPQKVDEARFRMKEEKALYDLVEKFGGELRTARLFEIEDITAYILALRDLKGPIDAYFDAVMVMDEDEALRLNRLATMNAVAALFRPLADFSRLTIK